MSIVKKGCGCGSILFVLLLIGVISTLTNKEAPKSVVPTTPDPRAVALPVTTTTQPPAPVELSLDPAPIEPDWTARQASQVSGFLPRFRPPRIGTNIQVRMTTGVVQKGILKALTETTVSLEMDQAMVTFEQSDIHPSSRIKLFSLDWAAKMATEAISVEAREFEKTRSVWAERQAELARKKASTAAEANKLARKTKIQEMFSKWDGSLPKLVETVKRSMHDDSSFEHVETAYSDDGTYVTVQMKFRGKNALGTKVLNCVRAKVDSSGNVLSCQSVDL